MACVCSGEDNRDSADRIACLTVTSKDDPSLALHRAKSASTDSWSPDGATRPKAMAAKETTLLEESFSRAINGSFDEVSEMSPHVRAAFARISAFSETKLETR